jgi:hypothetical protein
MKEVKANYLDHFLKLSLEDMLKNLEQVCDCSELTFLNDYEIKSGYFTAITSLLDTVECLTGEIGGSWESPEILPSRPLSEGGKKILWKILKNLISIQNAMKKHQTINEI